MNPNLALDFVKVTEDAALAAAAYVGRGEKETADGAAVQAMRARLKKLESSFRVVIGEGSRDQAPMLYRGELLGHSHHGHKIDLAVDPVENTNGVALGRENAISVIAAGPHGSLYEADDVYMEKLVVGPSLCQGLDPTKPTKQIIRDASRCLRKSMSEVTVALLDRPRHDQLVKDIRQTGARIRLISDGDVAGAIATALPNHRLDILLGIGGAPEGVLAAVAIRCLGGEFFGRLLPKQGNLEKVAQPKQSKDRWHTSQYFAKGKDLIFSATGITTGPLLEGVAYTDQGITTDSLSMRLKSKTIRFIKTHHVGR